MKIHTIGGFSEVGKNMVCLELDDDAFILDEGFYLPPLTTMEEREKFEYSEKKLAGIKAIPDDTVIDSIRQKVCAQLVGHAHLDHVGAVPYISDKYNAPICGTPFTTAVLRDLLVSKETHIHLRNKIQTIEPNHHAKIQGKKKKYEVEFINITHSTPQATIIAIRTDKGYVLYANDFKLDDNPMLGPQTNYRRLRELAKEGVYALILDSLYSGTDRKTPSEKIAYTLLEEVLTTIQNRNAGIIVTTFSSHIARLKSIVEFGKRINRQVVFVGRSLNKYAQAAQDVKIAPFFKDVKFVKYRREIEKELKKINDNRRRYLLVCTGHQGEPGSVLDRIARNQLPFRINKEDNIIFSSSVIPTPEDINKKNFAKLEQELKIKKARLFRDVHVSGHAGREDLRDMINLLKPQHIIPAHGGHDKTKPMIELAEELGYKSGKNCHLMSDGGVLKL